MDHSNANDAVNEMVNDLLSGLATATEYAVSGQSPRTIGSTDVASLLAEKFNCPLPFAQGLVSYWVKKHEFIAVKRGPNGGFVMKGEELATSKSAEGKARRASRPAPVIPGLNSLETTRPYSAGSDLPHPGTAETVALADDSSDDDNLSNDHQASFSDE